ncbi:MAG: NAD(P)/FAD-dependent oxidoreductase [Rhodoferax sp.]|uniref:flavin-containing monooxygenase n=1 Tax=Rhodoferax sp. TaxID=50421 RepID=UPI00271CC4B0|nr:NAD(P)/FAD-dependent oxidoreductase [Rhodoferax sp.]MDO8449652.1 NAD(P)/FAD-dependent oxidoreductase [Rhodoferax sp.]
MNQVDVAIVGAGFGGLCAAIRLRRSGVQSLLVLERSSEVGGTWRDNVYPGCACDVPSHLYSFSFEPNTEWTRPYPQQQEIQDYILRVVDKYRLRPVIRLKADVQQMRWLPDAQCWQIDLNGQPALLARHVVLATGPLNKPLIPDVPGLDSFAGPTFHSSLWRHDVALAGKRIAVVGTGASAVQIVPEIAPAAAHLDVFQRTPAWVLPRQDAPYGPFKRWLYRHVPGVQRLSRWRVYWFNEWIGMGFMGSDRMQNMLRRLSKHHMRRQIRDDGLRAALTPDFNPGCKRLLISNTWFPALQRPNVRLVTQAVTEIRPEGVVSADGTLHPCDVIIWGTGFKAAELVTPMRIYGESHSAADEAPELSALWRTQPAATRLGITVAGFPNMFLLVGPNTGLGHNSIIFMIEAQVDYIVAALRHLRRRGQTTLRLHPQVQQDSYAAMQRKMKGTVWSSGCRSWYQNAAGQIDTLWPGFTWQYWLQTRRFDAAHYE